MLIPNCTFLQEHHGENYFSEQFRKAILIGISSIGVTFNVIEMFCYAIFFHYVTYHNNFVASAILQQSVIKQRNNTNAISMLGLFISWVMEMWYILIVGLLSTKFEVGYLREVAATLKDFDFILIPFFQIITSVPMRKFIQPISMGNKRVS